MVHHTGRAFAPGHLTAFFRTADTPEDPLRKGSLGAGICLSHGARTTVTVTKASSPGDRWLEISINDEVEAAQVSRFALVAMLQDAGKRGWVAPLRDLSMVIRVKTTLELPEQSGWGMSGAGALSSALALRDALNLPYSHFGTAAFAHFAEVEHSTGLGDVPAQCAGGVEIRKRPGIQPHGFIDHIPCGPLEIVCLTLPEPLSTADVLSDPEKRDALNASGRVAMDGITDLPTLDMFFELSRKFTIKTGIADPKVIDILEKMWGIEKDDENGVGKGNRRGIGRGGMAMLGNSIFAVGDTEALVELFELHGRVDVCGIDNAGARVIGSEDFIE